MNTSIACKEHDVCGNRKGYGVVRHEGKNQLLHRLVYCQANGLSIEDIKGRVIRHTCDNSRCIEPAHLIIGTQADNVRDMLNRGRQCYTPFVPRSGTANPMSKLDYEKAKAIRAAYSDGAKQKDLARKYKVSKSLISYVVNNKIWGEAVGDINASIAPLSISAAGLAQLGFQPVPSKGAAKLYAADDMPAMILAMIDAIHGCYAESLTVPTLAQRKAG